MRNKFWLVLAGGLGLLVLAGAVGAAVRIVLMAPQTVLSATPPAEMFAAVLRRPVPADVTDLQGGGFTWQGYSLWLRFKTSPATLESLLAENYAAVACAEIQAHFDQSLENIEFTPPWAPLAVAQPVCYRSLQPVQNQWTSLGEHYFWIDREQGEVYFYGLGQ